MPKLFEEKGKFRDPMDVIPEAGDGRAMERLQMVEEISKGPNLPNLDKIVSRWKAILGLGGWVIKTGWVTQFHEDTRWKSASAQIAVPRRQAVIKLLHPDVLPDDDITSVEPWSADREIVHELIHILLVGWQTEEGAESDLKEQAINAIEKALVDGWGGVR